MLPAMFAMVSRRETTSVEVSQSGSFRFGLKGTREVLLEPTLQVLEYLGKAQGGKNVDLQAAYDWVTTLTVEALRAFEGYRQQNKVAPRFVAEHVHVHVQALLQASLPTTLQNILQALFRALLLSMMQPLLHAPSRGVLCHSRAERHVLGAAGAHFLRTHRVDRLRRLAVARLGNGRQGVVQEPSPPLACNLEATHLVADNG